MAHRRQGDRFENDWPLENMRKATEETYVKVVTVPVNVEIEADHKVLNYDRVKQLLTRARKIRLRIIFYINSPFFISSMVSSK